MVDPLGVKPAISGASGLSKVARIAAPNGIGPATNAPTGVARETTLAAAAKDAASRPPIDHERVALIRKAVAEGSFPIYPAKIADRLIALKLEWNPHEAA